MTSGASMARWLTTSMQCKSLLCKVLPLCKAANLACSYHFARQQTWHGRKSPAAHGRQLPGSPAPGWAWLMPWSAHSTLYCSLGWIWSCLPAGCSTSCAPLGPAQLPPLITRGTPHHKGQTHHKMPPLVPKCHH